MMTHLYRGNESITLCRQWNRLFMVPANDEGVLCDICERASRLLMRSFSDFRLDQSRRIEMFARKWK
jgi:hypothetical protein